MEPNAEATRLTVRVRSYTRRTARRSIAVNGVCLTVVDTTDDEFTVDVVPETLQRTSLNGIEPGRLVNLERAMSADGHWRPRRMGSCRRHRTFLSRDHDGLATAYPPSLSRYLVEKGSIAVDGVSLTVARVTDQEFAVALIPTTLRATTLGRNQPGDSVNLEVDVLAKYVEKLAAVHLTRSSVEDGGGEEDR